MDNRQLFGVEKHVNQLYLSSGRIYKMGDHGPDVSAVETGKFCSCQFLGCSIACVLFIRFLIYADRVSKRISLISSLVGSVLRRMRHFFLKSVQLYC